VYAACVCLCEYMFVGLYLTVRRALLNVGALSSECRALLSECRAVLQSLLS